MQVRQLLQFATGQLSASPSAALDAEVLLASLLRTGRERFYARPDMEVPAGAAADFRRLLESRKAGCPVAYLTGVKEFRSINFIVNAAVLAPRPETELLVELALERIPANSRARILDLGSGCGAVAVAVAAERPGCSVLAVDLSREALAVAHRNVAAAAVANVELRQSDWFANLSGRRFDAILCNPPYVEYPAGAPPPGLEHEPRLALDGGRRGMDCLRRVIAGALRHLVPGGFLLVEHGHDQGELVRRQFRLHPYRQVAAWRDYAGHERIAGARHP